VQARDGQKQQATENIGVGNAKYSIHDLFPKIKVL
jgi:hypothetical protein